MAAAAGGAAAWRFWPEQGLWNPCLAQLPRRLAEHELVRGAWEGVDAAQAWDSHVHLVGTGDSDSGIFVNPRMESLLNPGQYARRLFFLNAGCARSAPGNVDRAYVERMRNLIDGMRPGAKLLLYAFDRAHDERGAPDMQRTAFYVPDSYARDMAKRHPGYFEWAASIHPYRRDAVAALEKAQGEGARAVKWLPAAMGIDPASPRCNAFYEVMAKLNLPLISHAGEERAVLGHDTHDYGNPLRLRRALDAGVRVVIAHCASLLESEAWHARLLNGSDYPLPGVMPMYSVDYLVSLGMLAPQTAPILKEIRLHNPLLFDFIVKRHLRSNGKALSASVFETRMFFMR